MMQVWTNDRYQSSEHRAAVSSTKERFSIPFFLYPQIPFCITNFNTMCSFQSTILDQTSTLHSPPSPPFSPPSSLLVPSCHLFSFPLSVVCTPRNNIGGPHIKVRDPCHVLLPPPFRIFHDVRPNLVMSLRPDLEVGQGEADGEGGRQARAMGRMAMFKRVF